MYRILHYLISLSNDKKLVRQNEFCITMWANSAAKLTSGGLFMEFTEQVIISNYQINSSITPLVCCFSFKISGILL